MPEELLLKNAWIADGKASPLRKGAVYVKDNIVVSIGDAPVGIASSAVEDCAGRIVAPGFIDAHSHSDLSQLAHPDGFSRLAQGFTSEICGNCGLSPFPLTALNREHLHELYAGYGIELDWEDYLSYCRRVMDFQPQVRMFSLVGHNTLRAAAAGYEKHDLSGGEIERMTDLLDSSLDAGALGLSLGLLYVPGKFADRDEIVSLMRVLARHNAVLTTHLRSEGDYLLEAVAEMLDCARSAGLQKIHLSHLKTANPRNWHKIDPLLAMLDEAEKSGLRVTCDRYPYCESMTQLSVYLPSPWDDMTDDKVERELADAGTRAMLSDLIRAGREPDFWRHLRLAATNAEGYRESVGKTMAEISPDPAGVMVEILARDACGSYAAFAGMSEDNLLRIIKQPRCVAGSDGYALGENEKSAHPRSFGTAPRFLRLLLDNGVPLPEAVRKLTGLTAEIFGIADAGILTAGSMVPLVVFDPDSVDSDSSFDTPAVPAAGLRIIC